MTTCTIPNNTYLAQVAVKSIPGLPDVGVPHGDGSRTQARCPEGVRKNIQMTNLTMLNTISSMKFALKLVPGLPDVGVPHGDGDGPRTPPKNYA